MAKIDSRDFGDYVENQKNRLYEHCRENNVYVDKNASLEKIVDANNLIKNPDENMIKVRVFDYDGELLDTQYYNVGETVPEPPAPIPKDSRLKFKKWIRAVDSLIAERDFDFGALYESTVTKEVDGYTCKVTSFDCSFDEEYTGLNVSIPFYLSNFKIFVDWGDGTEITTLTNSGSGKATHTYSENGDYTIQIYGYPTATSTINWWFNTSSSTYLLGSKILNRALKQAIISSEYLISTSSSYMFYYAVNLKTIILDILFTKLPIGFLGYCSNLRGLVIPETIDTIEANAMGYNYNNKIVLSQNCKILNNILDKSVPFTVIIPDNIQNVGSIEGKSYKKLIFNSLIGNTSPKISYMPNLELLDFGNASIISINNPIEYNYNLTTLILPKNLSELKSGVPYCPKLKTLVIPDSVVTISYGLFSSSQIENLTIPNNWSSNIDFLNMFTLNINSWISIANRIKDLTGENAKIITMLAQYYSQLKDVYLNSNGEQVDKNTEGAINILDFITNKNWTVTFK